MKEINSRRYSINNERTKASLTVSTGDEIDDWGH
jgi:hypothetical protein